MALDPEYMDKHMNSAARKLISLDPALLPLPVAADSAPNVSPRDKSASGAKTAQSSGQTAAQNKATAAASRAALISSTSSPQLKRAALAVGINLSSSGGGAGRSSNMYV